MKGLTNVQYSTILGLLLSDGTLIKRNKGDRAGAYFSLTQTNNPRNKHVEAHVQLLLHSFELFKPFIKSDTPGQGVAKFNGRHYPYLYFNTIINPIFTSLYNDWYKDNIKVVPDSIFDLMDPIVLAFWVMGDGGKCGKGFHLNSTAFTTPEVLLLLKTLNLKFGLDCSIHTRNRIYLPTREMDRFKSIVQPHLLDLFGYKIL